MVIQETPDLVVTGILVIPWSRNKLSRTKSGHPGGTQGGSNNWTGGGGGGAGAAGANNGTTRAAGRDISITGNPFEYARGGAANSYPSTRRDEGGSYTEGAWSW